MAHYAKVLDGKVVQVIVADDDFMKSYVDTSPGEWIKTSYNTKNGVHYGQDGQPDGGVALRGNYACIGYTYDSINDVFYPPQPYPSWKISSPEWKWEPPTPIPEWGKPYGWDEDTKTWILYD
jgi:hypothetical protein